MSEIKKQEKKYPFEYTLSVINGKWKIRIMYQLFTKHVMRYGQLKTELETITHKMLSNQLKELEADGIIKREEYSQIPPKVEYSLTEKGQSLMPLVNGICLWGETNRPFEEGMTPDHVFHI